MSVLMFSHLSKKRDGQNIIKAACNFEKVKTK